MFERFTKDARRVILASVMTAADQGAKAGPQHLLLALATAGEGAGARVLAGYGVTPTKLQTAVAGRTRRAGLTDDEVAAMRSVGVDADEVFRRVEEAFGPGAFDEPAAEPRHRRGLVGGPFDAQGKKVIELSLRETIALGRKHIGSEHILLALLRNGVPGPMSTVLNEHAVTYEDAKQRALADLRNSGQAPTED